MSDKKIVWSIAGSDCSGLAGQVADVRAIEALGVHPCMITTAVTAQNSSQVVALQALTAEQVAAQFSALNTELKADAIKVGMLPNQEIIEQLLLMLEGYPGPVIVDPVLVSSSGTALMEQSALNSFKKLFPYITLLTPNLEELKVLTGVKVENLFDLQKATAVLLEQGVAAVLVKGGHWTGEQAVDYYSDGKESFYLISAKQQQNNNRGTGCVLAAAIAAGLAKQYTLKDALVIGKMLINQALRNGYQVGTSKGPLRPTGWPQQESDCPVLIPAKTLSKEQKIASRLGTKACYEQIIAGENLSFADCGIKDLGLYPVVDSADWIARLLELGVTTIQLRVKDLTEAALEAEIKQAIELANKKQARLFINDHWQLAIKHQAYGVHLGQEDLLTADLEQISNAGLRLGLSTHCYYEVARAHAIKPSYLACGPVFHTDSKQMPWIPGGLENLSYWLNCMESYPWVAIGGIDLTNFKAVADTGVSGIAMISAITHAEDPEAVTKQMLSILQSRL